MGIISEALVHARDDALSPGHKFFCGAPMSRHDGVSIAPETSLDYIQVIRLEGADHWYRPPVGDLVFAAIAPATYPSGRKLILFLMGNTPVCVEDVPVKVKGTGCCWPMGPGDGITPEEPDDVPA